MTAIVENVTVTFKRDEESGVLFVAFDIEDKTEKATLEFKNVNFVIEGADLETAEKPFLKVLGNSSLGLFASHEDLCKYEDAHLGLFRVYAPEVPIGVFNATARMNAHWQYIPEPSVSGLDREINCTKNVQEYYLRGQLGEKKKETS